MAGLEGSVVKSAHEMGLPTIGKEINHYYGNTAQAIVKPSGATVLYLQAEAGNFRFQVGDTDATLTATAPAAEVDDGTGSLYIAENALWTVCAPGVFTVIGDAADAILTYWWL